MRADLYFETLRSCPVATLDNLTGGSPIVIISPHPDDEALGAGGLIAEACARNQDVRVIIVTDGSGSHPKSKKYSRQRLVDLRYEEVAKAGLPLGLESHRLTFLGLPDTRAPNAGPEFDFAVRQILDVLHRSHARSLFVTWGGDPHCDHKASAEMAKSVRQLCPDLMLWAYPIWGWHLAADFDIAHPFSKRFRLNISQYRDRKRAAIEAYASQMTDLIDDDPEGFRFDEKSLAPFLGEFEYFIEVPR